jgi:hypothetical protein
MVNRIFNMVGYVNPIFKMLVRAQPGVSPIGAVHEGFPVGRTRERGAGDPSPRNPARPVRA